MKHRPALRKIRLYFLEFVQNTIHGGEARSNAYSVKSIINNYVKKQQPQPLWDAGCYVFQTGVLSLYIHKLLLLIQE